MYIQGNNTYVSTVTSVSQNAINIEGATSILPRSPLGLNVVICNVLKQRITKVGPFFFKVGFNWPILSLP
jgi:hypothetical protein